MTNPGESQIRQFLSHQIDTFRDDDRSNPEVPMLDRAASTDGRFRLTDQRLTPTIPRRYVAPMTVSANSVLAAITERRPDQSPDRRHLLLFFCQGHYLANTGTPLFAEPLHAIPTGVHVEIEHADEPDPMNNRQLGIIGYTLHRYADMDSADLLSLVQISSAWQMARRDPDETRIEWTWLSDWFRRPAERAGKPTAEEAAEFAARRKARMGG